MRRLVLPAVLWLCPRLSPRAGANSWAHSLADGWAISLTGAKSWAVSRVGKGDWPHDDDWSRSSREPPEEPR